MLVLISNKDDGGGTVISTSMLVIRWIRGSKRHDQRWLARYTACPEGALIVHIVEWEALEGGDFEKYRIYSGGSMEGYISRE